MPCSSCGKTRIAGYGKTIGTTSSVKKSSSYGRTVQVSQHGMPKVKISFAKRGGS